jgi:uncharacterized membrane protein YozB (DUF420 family)
MDNTLACMWLIPNCKTAKIENHKEFLTVSKCNLPHFLIIFIYKPSVEQNTDCNGS